MIASTLKIELAISSFRSLALVVPCRTNPMLFFKAFCVLPVHERVFEFSSRLSIARVMSAQRLRIT